MSSAWPSISTGPATTISTTSCSRSRRSPEVRSATSFAIIDERGRRVAGTLEPESQQTVARRGFPVLFFDPTLVAVNPPADLAQRSWTVATSAAGDPTFVLAARGARRSLVVVGAGVALLALSLLATARAARASAAVATVRADFVATVTHELKTPLSTIRAVGETLVRGRVKTDQDLKRYAHLLVREERRLTRLVNNLLAYSRVTDVTEVYSFESSRTGSAHFRSDAGIPPAADRQRRSARNRCAARNAGGPGRSHRHRARARQPDRQRDSLFRRGRNSIRARVRRGGSRALRRHRSRRRHSGR